MYSTLIDRRFIDPNGFLSGTSTKYDFLSLVGDNSGGLSLLSGALDRNELADGTIVESMVVDCNKFAVIDSGALEPNAAAEGTLIASGISIRVAFSKDKTSGRRSVLSAILYCFSSYYFLKGNLPKF